MEHIFWSTIPRRFAVSVDLAKATLIFWSCIFATAALTATCKVKRCFSWELEAWKWTKHSNIIAYAFKILKIEIKYPIVARVKHKSVGHTQLGKLEFFSTLALLTLEKQ